MVATAGLIMSVWPCPREFKFKSPHTRKFEVGPHRSQHHRAHCSYCTQDRHSSVTQAQSLPLLFRPVRRHTIQRAQPAMAGAGEDAASLKDQANAAFKEQQYLKAAALYTKAIKLDPQNAVLFR